MKNVLVLLFGAGMACSAWALDPAKTTRNSELLKEPIAGSPKIASVAAGATVGVGEKKGFWVRVTAGELSGWLKLSDIELQVNKARIDPLATGRAGSGNIVNTAGARGLSPDELKAAAPNPRQVEAAIQASAQIAAADIEQFAKAGNVNARTGIPQASLTVAATKSTVTAESPSAKAAAKPGKNDDNW